jgi:hypothetical protein
VIEELRLQSLPLQNFAAVPVFKLLSEIRLSAIERDALSIHISAIIRAKRCDETPDIVFAFADPAHGNGGDECGRFIRIGFNPAL